MAEGPWAQGLWSVLNWILSQVPYVVPTLLVGTGFLVGVHSYMKKARLSVTSFGLVAYAALLCSFNVEVLRHGYAAILPVTGFVSVSDKLMTWACYKVIEFGPVHVMSVTFVCNSLLLTPVLLVPPVLSAPDRVTRQVWQSLGVGDSPTAAANSPRASPGCCESSLLRVYMIASALLLMSAGSVYSFAEHHDADIAADFVKEWSIVSQVLPSETSQPIANPALVTLMYSILAMAKLVIVYERVTGSSFHADFPVLMLVRAFPCLAQCPSVSGQMAALAAKRGELKRFAQCAWSILQAAQVEVPLAHKEVQRHFAAAKASLAREPVVVSPGGDLSEEDIAAAELRVRESALGAVRDLCSQFSAPQTPAEQATAAFFGYAQDLLRELKAPESVLPRGVLPGDNELESRLTDLVVFTVGEVFAALRSGAPRFEGDGSSEMASTWLTGMSAQALDRARAVTLSGFDAFLTQLKDLALFAGVPRSVVERAYSASKQFADAAKDARDDAEFFELEAERLVDLAKEVPFLARRWWAWAYYVLGLALGLLVWAHGIGTLSALAQLAASWTELQDATAIILVAPLLTLFFYCMYFWFTSSKRAIVPAESGPLSSAKVATAVGMAAGLALGIAAACCLVALAVRARRADVLDECLALLQNSTHA